MSVLPGPIWYMKRHDGVHIVMRWLSWTGFEHTPRIDAQGRGLEDDGRQAELACGRHAKLNPGSQNRITPGPPTCTECLIVDAYGKDYRCSTKKK